jgi:thiol-disulfide isomerase/thioredoxin
MQSKTKTVILIFTFSAILPMITGLLTKGIDYNTLLIYPCYFYLTIFCLSRFRNYLDEKIILLVIVLGYTIPAIDVIYDYFIDTIWSLPLFVFSLWAIFSGYICWKIKNIFNLFPFFIGSILVSFMFFQGWTYWIHKSNFGTFTGKISASKLQQTINGIDQNNTQINNQTLANKIVLLDFWHTGCGVCFQKFPQLQAFYDKYKNDDSIAVYAVNKPIEEDKQKSAFKVIEEEGYNFPVLLPTDEELAEKFGVRVYPTTFVIDKQSNIIYKGDIEGAIQLIEELRKQ